MNGTPTKRDKNGCHVLADGDQLIVTGITHVHMQSPEELRRRESEIHGVTRVLVRQRLTSSYEVTFYALPKNGIFYFNVLMFIEFLHGLIFTKSVPCLCHIVCKLM